MNGRWLIKVLLAFTCIVTSVTIVRSEDQSLSKTSAFTSDRYLSSLVGNVTHHNVRIKETAIEELGQLRDTRAIPILIDLLSAGDASSEKIILALKKLSQKDYGGNWLDWASWTRALEISPIDVYDEFKKDLFKRLDPALAIFSFDRMAPGITLQDLFWSGELKDGAPAINSPKMVRERAATFLGDDDIVYGILVGGAARAYPEKILNWHLIINDTVGPRPVTLMMCPYSRTASAYDTHELNGLTFGFSGLVAQQSFVMYDHRNAGLWNASTGKAITGSSAAEGLSLTRIPITRTTWKAWRDATSKSLVLDINTGYKINYEDLSPFKSFEMEQDNSAQNPLVYGVYLQKSAKAYLITELREKRIVNDNIGGLDLVILYENKGGAIYTFERNAHNFVECGGSTVTDQNGQLWKIKEDALYSKESDKTLKRLPGQTALLSAWLTWYPESKYEHARTKSV
ncbi:MAG: DUF3179 domain-containing protein [Candidatus Omnitrophica bacterium]|nr:DUF3179 domain-containing protein [Candidatus Omnitrophota bacterium]